MAWSELSRHERGYDAKWVKLRQRILHRDLYLCQACLDVGRTTQATDVDHIIAKAKDGSDDPENLQSLCRSCHVAKTRAENSNRTTFGADGWPIG